MSIITDGCVYATFLLTILVLLKVYSVFTRGKCHSTKKLDGKTALVTGSNRVSGIGYYVALDLAQRGARVILTSKNYNDCCRARDKIIRKTGNTQIIAKNLDYLSLKEVRKFAENILTTENRLDILVNNAGTSGLGNKYTEDGLLPSMQVNYFGPFLLTNLLLGLLKKNPSRIVNVASFLSQLTLGFHPENINYCADGEFFELLVYSNSKYCVYLATLEMASRLKGSGVTVNCVHPGAVSTDMLNASKKRFATYISATLGPLYFKTPKQGAETSIHVAVCESVEGVTGKYFSDCRESSIWLNKSSERRKQVWDQTVKLVKLSPEEMFYD